MFPITPREVPRRSAADPCSHTPSVPSGTTAPARPLRILMLAPEPFFEPRGHAVQRVSPDQGAGRAGPSRRSRHLSVRRGRRRCRTCASSDRRAAVRRAGCRSARRSTKLVLDVLLAVTALRQAMARALRPRPFARRGRRRSACGSRRRLGIPHLYDMHSSLPQQLTNFRFARAALLRGCSRSWRTASVLGSEVVDHDLPGAAGHVDAHGRRRPRRADRERDGRRRREPPPVPAGGRPRAQWGIEADAPLLLYTGTFEPYQGLDLLLEAVGAAGADASRTRASLIVGGGPEQVEAARARAAAPARTAVFTGQRPRARFPHFVEACDILASPRISGTNTPLKIYSYLRSGRPIVATNLLTHTQVLDRETAVLVDAEAAARSRPRSRGCSTIRRSAPRLAARGAASAPRDALQPRRPTSRARGWRLRARSTAARVRGARASAGSRRSA